MLSYSSLFVTCLLVAYARTAPVNEKRDADNPTIVQGLLGTDNFWNDYDGGVNHYVTYKGNGSFGAGWPNADSWVSFNEMWITNAHIVARSCDLIYHVANNNEQELTWLYNAIKQVAHETRVDHRFIFAAILQETDGCVRAGTDVYPDGSTNTGLLKAYKGSHTCNENGVIKTPCPEDQILGMIRDGIEGTTEGHGFAEDINEQASYVGNDVAQAYYRAARLYDSGAIDGSGDLEKAREGEHCYSSDIANRLMGWTDAATTCDLDG